jgi:hypothetical protein
MNRRFNASSEVAHLLAEVRQLTPEEVLEAHGIEIDIVDKTVYDATYEQTFKNIQAWAQFVVAQENDEFEDEDEFSSQWDENE